MVSFNILCAYITNYILFFIFMFLEFSICILDY
jgi:hypothetical protein